MAVFYHKKSVNLPIIDVVALNLYFLVVEIVMLLLILANTTF